MDLPWRNTMMYLTTHLSWKWQGWATPPLHKLTKAKACCGQKLILTSFNTCEQAPAGVNPCQQLCKVAFARQWNLIVHLEGTQWEFQKTLSHGDGYAVSNGLFKDELGAMAWIIEGPTLALRLTGHWHMPGSPLDHSSFHSELAGIIGVLYMLTFPPKKQQNLPSDLHAMAFQWCLTYMHHGQLNQWSPCWSPHSG